jgi:fatty-acyl-CoA synthase
MNCENWVGNYSFFRSRISPDREAVYDYDRNIHYSYGDLEYRANVLANYLVDELNIKKGDRIAFCSRNSIELIDAYSATAKTGTILTTYNPYLSDAELTAMINNEEPVVLFYEDLFEGVVNKIRPNINVKSYIVMSNKACDDLNYEDIMKYGKSDYIECKDLDLEDIHLLIHTGGTTGVPKGAKISHRALLYNAMSEILTLNLTGSDSAYVFMPLFHTAGWNIILLPILHVGGRITISKNIDPKLIIDIIQDERPTVLLGVSTIFRMIINHPDFENADFSSLRWMLSGAAPTSVDIMEKFWEKNVKFVLAYGMTEAGPNNLCPVADNMSMETIREKCQSVGKPMYFNNVRIVNDDGEEVGPNEHGEIIWSGPLIFSGYWNNEKETNETLRNGWVYTGDIAMKDEDGYYYIVGRKKNMYITGGENIFPTEIEKKIYRHPKVHEVCVIGVPDDKWGEVGKAVVSLKSDYHLSQEELKEFLKGKIGSIEIPKYIQIVEELPKNNAGKVQRGVIMEMYR